MKLLINTRMNMRKLINLCETLNPLPSWLEAGTIVRDPAAINDDCNDILDAHEWGWVWRLCDVPVSVFGRIFKPDFDQEMNPENNSEFRFECIRSATEYDPVICAYQREKLKLLDGHHRLYVIGAERGDQTIRALVGTPKVRKISRGPA